MLEGNTLFIHRIFHSMGIPKLILLGLLFYILLTWPYRGGRVFDWRYLLIHIFWLYRHVDKNWESSGFSSCLLHHLPRTLVKPAGRAKACASEPDFSLLGWVSVCTQQEAVLTFQGFLRTMLAVFCCVSLPEDVFHLGILISYLHYLHLPGLSPGKWLGSCKPFSWKIPLGTLSRCLNCSCC